MPAGSGDGGRGDLHDEPFGRRSILTDGFWSAICCEVAANGAFTKP
jgi:hypothetical protein